MEGVREGAFAKFANPLVHQAQILDLLWTCGLGLTRLVFASYDNFRSQTMSNFTVSNVSFQKTASYDANEGGSMKLVEPESGRPFCRREFGDQVRRLRRACRMSQEELARAVFLSASQLSRIETGRKKEISIELVECLARHLRVTPSNLVGWAA